MGAIVCGSFFGMSGLGGFSCGWVCVSSCLLRRSLRLLCCVPLGALLLVVYNRTGTLVSSAPLFPGYYYALRPGRGPGGTGPGTGGASPNRKVLRTTIQGITSRVHPGSLTQGITAPVQRRAVPGFTLGFSAGSTMGSTSVSLTSSTRRTVVC